MNNDYREEYVTINGIPQYLLHYPQENKPVLLFLHGGPGAAEHLMAYKLNPYFSEIVTQVHWDQRGAGKTLLKNKQNGSSQSLEQMMEDLHQVVAKEASGMSSGEMLQIMRKSPWLNFTTEESHI